jgi:hypothetical protein
MWNWIARDQSNSFIKTLVSKSMVQKTGSSTKHHHGVRSHDHKVKGVVLYRLSQVGRALYPTDQIQKEMQHSL